MASCWISNMLISTKPWKAIGPPKSDNYNNSNYSNVKDFDGSSCIYIVTFKNQLFELSMFLSMFGETQVSSLLHIPLHRHDINWLTKNHRFLLTMTIQFINFVPRPWHFLRPVMIFSMARGCQKRSAAFWSMCLWSNRDGVI